MLRGHADTDVQKKELTAHEIFSRSSSRWGGLKSEGPYEENNWLEECQEYEPLLIR